MNKEDLFWQSYQNIEEDVLELSKVLYITDIDKQLEVYSPYIADLLVRCCVEIEAISKELFVIKGGNSNNASLSSLYFDTDCIKYLNDKYDLDEKIVNVVAREFDLHNQDNIVLRPLYRAYKRQGTYWEKAYQAVKHDRYNSLKKGNVKALICALAALYLLNIYLRNEQFKIKYNNRKNLDMRFGSKVFSLNQPNECTGLWYSNNSHPVDSPYVIKYTDDSYKKIVDMQTNNNKAISDYVMKQPEINEPEFVKQITNAIEEQKKDPSKRVMVLWELAYYRMLKKIPKDLPFEQRKKMFLYCPEYKDRTYQLNLKDKEITEKNIDAEIYNLSTILGINLEMKLTQRWEIWATTDAMCDVVISEK